MNISSIIAAENAASTFFFVSAADLAEFAQTIVSEAIHQKALESEAQQDRLLSSKEVRERFNVCASTLWRWQGAGLICPVKVGGQNRYYLSEVERVLSGRRG